MKNIMKSLAVIIAAATPAFATGDGGSGNGLLMSAFFGFAALVIVFQFVPALVLLGGMLKGLFSSAAPEPKK
ncbi:hypothetical protein LPW11_01835 [Geomonas sp. RF6]|uniref:hypothetical protein n=1 Tax=Geomonas sp. RF6 TaxID=2897342 RepID=UPI001E38290D|nr:hypothetical protein [Geomonas sp. RF6]UFS70937.1 hypothetical protein LPW11_01835 [Geomonas sp. RF6]